MIKTMMTTNKYATVDGKSPPGLRYTHKESKNWERKRYSSPGKSIPTDSPVSIGQPCKHVYNYHYVDCIGYSYGYICIYGYIHAITVIFKAMYLKEGREGWEVLEGGDKRETL